MRIFLTVLLLIFSLQSWTKADDIRDFEIEGITVEDSALNYYTKNFIESKKKHYYPSSNKYFRINFIEYYPEFCNLTNNLIDLL